MSHPPPIGAVIDERYRLDELLNRSDSATVFRAVDTGSRREVVIKVLNEPPQHRARFERELQVIAGLRDPHTVRLFAHGEVNARPYMVMEYVPGEDLDARMRSEGALSIDVVSHVLRQLLHSLREAHRAGVIHRDVRPSNVRVFEYEDDAWRVKLIDFGLAHVDAQGGQRLTKTGEQLGAPRFMSPEQLAGGQVGPPTDIYTLGLLAVEMLAGPTMLAEDPLDRLRTGHLVAVDTKHAWFDAVLNRMTARRPEDRYQSADAVLRALDERREPVAPAVAPPRALPAAEPKSALPWIAPTVGMVLVVALGLAYVVAVPTTPEIAEPTPQHRANPLAQAKPLLQREVVLTARDVGGSTGPQVRERQIQHDGETRTYWVRTPEGVRTDQPSKMVLLFQTQGMSRTDLLAMSGAAETADREQLFLLSFDKPSTEAFAPDDVEYVIKAIENEATPQTDVFAIGHGLGGQFVRLLACRWELEAIATIGDFVSEAPSCARQVPYLKLTGKDDRLAPLQGGSNFLGQTSWSAARTEKAWRKRNRCGTAERWRDFDECTTWSCETPFVSCVYAGGHCFSGTTSDIALVLMCGGGEPSFPILQAAATFFDEVAG